MKLSILFPETRSVERAIARIEQLEELGFHSAVMGHAMDFDPIAVFALAGARTERILLTTAVVPLFSRHPISLAMSAATAQAASRGRFRLGIGPSHQPLVEHVYGLAYDKPVRRVREYVTIVRELLQQGATPASAASSTACRPRTPSRAVAACRCWSRRSPTRCAAPRARCRTACCRGSRPRVMSRSTLRRRCAPVPTRRGAARRRSSPRTRARSRAIPRRCARRSVATWASISRCRPIARCSSARACRTRRAGRRSAGPTR